MTRQVYEGTVEAGSVSGMARLDLGDVHMWLYPDETDPKKVRVEVEEKSIAEMLIGRRVTVRVVPPKKIVELPPTDHEWLETGPP
jgi:hypothetical protein